MTYDLTYERATSPTSGPQPGTVQLLDYITKRWTTAWSKGIYNKRRIRGSLLRWSIHAEGRAVDIGVSMTASGETTGNAIARWAVANAPDLGLQFLIWNRRKWRHDYGWKPYRGVSPHRDHLHLEQTREAARTWTPDRLEAGPYGRQEPRRDPPLTIRVVAHAKSPTGGVWLLGPDGAVYAFDAPYLGGLNHDPVTRKPVADVFGRAANIESILGGYRILTTTGHGYEFT